MSNTAGRGEQIVARLFVKVALLISDARLTNQEVLGPGVQPRTDKWFQLEVRDDGAFTGLAQELKEMAAEAGTGPLELRVRTVLTLPHLAPPSAQALVLLPESGSKKTKRVRVDMPDSARGILLEEWSITLDRTAYPAHTDDPYPGVYKQAIALMRSLFALLRYVPTWQLHRKLGSGAPMQITVGALLDTEPLDEDILGLERKLVRDDPGPSTFAFPPITTPLGSITLRVHYRPHTRFRLDPLENLWSSAFASGPPSPRTAASPTSPSPPTPARGTGLDADQLAFTPTLLSRNARTSLTGSGSPLRPSRPGTGPSTTPTVGAGFPSIRPRTVSQLSSGGEPGSPRPRRIELARSPPSSPRLGTMAEVTGGEAGGSGLSRTRTQSLLSAGAGRGGLFAATGGTGTGAVLGVGGETPPSPGPGRRPSGINPFKSGTLSSSPRISGGIGVGGSPRTTPGLGIGSSPRSGLSLAAGGTGSDGRRSLDSGPGDTPAAGGGAQPQPIKRYDSSFGHRTGRSHGSVGSGSAVGVIGGVGSAGTGGGGIPGSLGVAGGSGGGSVGAGSMGSGGTGAGGGGVGEQHRRLTTIGSQSYESQIADVDEIGQFLAEIDGRPQLGLDVSGAGAASEGTGIGTERFPLSSPVQERLPLGSPRPVSSPLTSSPRPGAIPLGSSPRLGALPSPRFPSSSHRRLPSIDSEPARAERFPPSSLPTRYSGLPDVTRSPLSPDVPRMLPPALQSVPPSPAESAWPSRFRDRSTSRERGSRDRGSRTRGFGEQPLAPLPERGLGPLALGDRDRVRAMSLAGPASSIRTRTSSLTPSTHERERTLSFARRNRTMLTNAEEVEAAMLLMQASFQANYAPASPSGTGPGTPLAESGRRQIGNDEIVGRLELGGSGSVGGRSAGSMRPGRDTDTWREGGEWDQRMGGWR